MGFKIYSKGKYYGTIIKETNCFWVIKNLKKTLTGDELLDTDYFIKDDFDLRFIKGDFDGVEVEGDD